MGWLNDDLRFVNVLEFRHSPMIISLLFQLCMVGKVSQHQTLIN